LALEAAALADDAALTAALLDRPLHYRTRARKRPALGEVTAYGRAQQLHRTNRTPVERV